MDAKTENTYSNIIAPSDGVRRFLCKTSVIFVGVIALIYSVFAFRMNSMEHNFSGGSLRCTMLYAAYVLVPLGVIVAAVFARLKQCGLAYSMIALIVSAAGMLMLFLNSLSAIFKESSVQGITGSFLEMLALGLLLAIFVNLILSCINCRLLHVLGLAGAIASASALIATAARTATSYSAMQFAWNKAFDWNNLHDQVSSENLQSQAEWIFRCISLSSPEASEMFMLRFYERIAACLLYGVLIIFFMKYNKEMLNFNKLLEHAGEYVDIPQAHIAETLAETEKKIQDKLKAGTQSVKERLKNMQNKEDEDLQELSMNFTEHEEFPYPDNSMPGRRRPDEYGEEERRREPRRRPDEYGEEERRREPRRRSDEYGEEERRREPRRRSDEYGEEERRREPRRRPDEYGEEERRREPRRRTDEYGEEERRREPRRRPDEYGEEERRREPRRRSDEYGEEERRREPRRRPDENGEEERRREPRRRPDEYGEEERRPEPRRRYRDEDMTAEERYLMEERRRRNPNYDEESELRRRRMRRENYGTSERDSERARQERRRRAEGGTQQNLNDYYNNYMSRQRRNNDSENNRNM